MLSSRSDKCYYCFETDKDGDFIVIYKDNGDENYLMCNACYHTRVPENYDE